MADITFQLWQKGWLKKAGSRSRLKTEGIMVWFWWSSKCKFKVGRQRQCASRCLSLLLHCRNTTTLLLSFGSCCMLPVATLNTLIAPPPNTKLRGSVWRFRVMPILHAFDGFRCMFKNSFARWSSIIQRSDGGQPFDLHAISGLRVLWYSLGSPVASEALVG